MAKYLLLFVYQLLFTYSTWPLNVPVCDCNKAKTRGILDINKPYYCQNGAIDTPHKPRITSSYTLVTKQKPIVTWKGWSCQQWIKSKKIVGSFWIDRWMMIDGLDPSTQHLHKEQSLYLLSNVGKWLTTENAETTRCRQAIAQ